MHSRYDGRHMNPILVGALLFALLLAIVGTMVWQEAKKRPVTEAATYVVDDAARFIYPLLSDPVIDRLDLDDVRRILEWEVRYLQGADAPRKGEEVPVAGGSDEAVAFISSRLRRDGVPRYSEQEIREVLRHEGAYLVEIGAVGRQVEGAGE
jgi:hypothetical protein